MQSLIGKVWVNTWDCISIRFPGEDKAADGGPPSKEQG